MVDFENTCDVEGNMENGLGNTLDGHGIIDHIEGKLLITMTPGSFVVTRTGVFADPIAVRAQG